MGFMDLFKRKPVEVRSSGAGYTSQLIQARAAFIAGASGLGELTGAVQACVSLWEGGLGLADVNGTDMLSRRALALTARALALRGEAVFLIRERLIPCSDWDVTTVDGEPRSYRLQVPEAGGPRSVIALAGEVVHFRIGSDPITPWAGAAPLRRAQLSAELLHELESALRDTFRDAPFGSQIVPVPEGSADDMAALRLGFRGRRGQALVIEGVAQAVGAGMHPNLGKSPDQLSPDLQRTLADRLLIEAKGSVYSVFGVLPGLMNPATTGPMVREAQRHLATWVLQPMAEMIAEEATAKLGSMVTLDVHRHLQSFDAGGSARAVAGIVQALAQAKEAGLSDATVQAAFGALDWKEALAGNE